MTAAPPTAREPGERRRRAAAVAHGARYAPRHVKTPHQPRGRGLVPVLLVTAAVVLTSGADHDGGDHLRTAGALTLDRPAADAPAPTTLAAPPQAVPAPLPAASGLPTAASRARSRPGVLPARPVEGAITSVFGPRWGRQHGGIDLRASTGTPVVSALAGTVESAGWAGGYGRLVTVRHGDGTVTAYAHLSQTAVRTGEPVERGQLLGLSGATGNVTGPHLHFEVRTAGGKRDPEQWLRDVVAS